MSILRIGRYALRTKRGKKLLSAAQKLLRRKEAAKEYRKVFKSVHAERLYVKGKRTLAKSKEFKQKPLKGSPQGPDIITQQSTHYGPRGVELKIKSRKARATSWIGAESWRNEMARMYGGVHMSQTKEGAKKSVNILAKEYKKRFKKKKVKKLLAGGLLSRGIRLIYRDPKSREAIKKLTTYVKDIYKKKKLGPTGTLELKGRKIEGLKKYIDLIKSKSTVERFKTKAGVAKAIKVMDVAKHRLLKYEKKHKNIVKVYMHKMANPQIKTHSEGGEVVIGKNVDRSLL